MIIDKLYEQAQQTYGICVGLDTAYSYIPEYIVRKDVSLSEKVFEFNKGIIDATADLAACYKPQIAYYEAMGIEGLIAYSKTLKYLKSIGKISIADVKRGDISETGVQYARAHLSGEFEADIMTVNAYMGQDALSPYYEYLSKGKGIFALVKTSNPSSVDFQDIQLTDMKLYEYMGKKISDWGERFIGESGFSAIGAVVGLTYPKDFDRIKPMMKHTFFLIPGYGAQGGTGEDIAGFFKDGICGVVNSSRGIIARHVKKGIGEGYADEARRAALEMKEDISKWL